MIPLPPELVGTPGFVGPPGSLRGIPPPRPQSSPSGSGPGPPGSAFLPGPAGLSAPPFPAVSPSSANPSGPLGFPAPLSPPNPSAPLSLPRGLDEEKKPGKEVVITEEDRVHWMRTFLSALEAWKTSLDEVKEVADTYVEPAAPTPPPDEPEQPTSAMSDEQMAVYAANAQIAQQQYLQQFQFWQQMRANEVAGWKCPACHNFNYSDRTVCNRRSCNAEKPKVDPITDVAAVTFDAVAAAAAAVQAGSGTLMPVAAVPFGQPQDLQQEPRFKEGFRPMRLCKHLMTRGFCGQSDQCTFAHTLNELHHSSPDLPQSELRPPPEPAPPSKRYKTEGVRDADPASLGWNEYEPEEGS